ncbi:MAG: hypothetical protein HJHJAOHD_02521 [Flavobacteriales bacterium]|nr:hypothetical protein [Flavobacteriales bacterium]
METHSGASNEVNQRLSSTTQKQNSGDATPGPRDKRIGGISGATPHGVSQQWGLPYHPQYVTKTSELFEVKEGAYLIVNPRNNEDKMVLLNTRWNSKGTKFRFRRSETCLPIRNTLKQIYYGFINKEIE